MSPHLLCIGGDDHDLRIPFMLALASRGFRVTAAGTGDPAPFKCVGLDFRAINFDRFVNPIADWTAIKALSRLLADVGAELVQSFDTKPNLLVPLAARGLRDIFVIRTINGKPLSTSDELRQQLANFKTGDSVAFEIERQSAFQYVAFEIE